MAKSHPVDEKIYIYYKWCKACGICLGLCPAHVFELGADGKPLVRHPENCTLCGMCETHCPDFAIGWTTPLTDKPDVADTEGSGQTGEETKDEKPEEPAKKVKK